MAFNWEDLLKYGGAGASAGSLFGPVGAGIGGGLGALFSLFGGGGHKPQAPNINSPQYQLGQYPTEWVNRGETAIKAQTDQWLKNALRGIGQTASQRGLLDSSYQMEKGGEASGTAAAGMSQALASLYGQAAEMQQRGGIAGMGQYAQDYNTWLATMNGMQDNWISGIMQMLPLINTNITDWKKRNG